MSATPTPADRDLDLVLVGATGFVGRLTAAHLASRAGALRVALAGRSRGRLEEVRAGLGPGATDWQVVVVDAFDTAGLRDLATRSRVVASATGPYLRLGLPLAAACAHAGTQYADLTGETLFVRRCADMLHDEAVRTGARLVHSCGFDSVPSDLAVLLTAERARADRAGGLESTTLVVRRMAGGISGGTVDSARQQAIAAATDPWAREVLADPYALSPDRGAEPGSYSPPTERSRLDHAKHAITRSVPVRRDPRTGHWYGPFVMGPFNTRLVRRSNALTGWSYGRGLRYREVLDFGSSPTAPLVGAGTSVALGLTVAAMGNRHTRSVVDRWLPKPGQGPSRSQRAAGGFTMEVLARTATGAQYRTIFGADLDPGYDGTAVMFGQSALALTEDAPGASVLPGGVLTPATGIGTVLAERLRAEGFTITTERLD